MPDSSLKLLVQSIVAGKLLARSKYFQQDLRVQCTFPNSSIGLCRFSGLLNGFSVFGLMIPFGQPSNAANEVSFPKMTLLL